MILPEDVIAQTIRTWGHLCGAGELGEKCIKGLYECGFTIINPEREADVENPAAAQS